MLFSTSDLHHRAITSYHKSGAVSELPIINKSQWIYCTLCMSEMASSVWCVVPSLLQTPRYLVQRSHNQWGSESRNWKRHLAVWRPPLERSEKTQTEMARAGHMISWTDQDYPTGNSWRRKTKRQTEETMGRQHQRVDWPWMEHYPTESWEPWGVEEAGCKIYSGAQTISQTTGYIR